MSEVIQYATIEPGQRIKIERGDFVGWCARVEDSPACCARVAHFSTAADLHAWLGVVLGLTDHPRG